MLSWIVLILILALLSIIGVRVFASVFGRGEAQPPMPPTADVKEANRRAVEEGILDTEAISHVGTRGPLYGKKDLDDDHRMGFGIVTSSDVFRQGVDEIVDQLRERIGGRPLYISVDIDVLDPAHAPGTGTPEAGGITSRELLEILRGLRGLDIVGADLVEVAPAYDHAELTGVAASHVAYDLISLMADRRATRAAAGEEPGR